MRILEIYEKYKLMPSLQEHMFRVSAVAQVICDNSTVEVDEKAIISTCLMHDMGNMIKFDLKAFPEFLKPEGLDYWVDVQNEYFNKYGRDEHEATLAIAKEIGVGEKIIGYLEIVGLDNVGVVKNIDNKICTYSDMRVGPHGVLPLDDRLNNLFERQKNRGVYDQDSTNKAVQLLKDFEREIFDKSRIDPSGLNDNTVEPVMEKLREYKLEIDSAS